MDRFMPKVGTLERIFVDKIMSQQEGVTYLDFIGTGITEENIDQVVQNLRNNMFESEDDDKLKVDA